LELAVGAFNEADGFNGLLVGYKLKTYRIIRWPDKISPTALCDFQ